MYPVRRSTLVVLWGIAVAFPSTALAIERAGLDPMVFQQVQAYLFGPTVGNEVIDLTSCGEAAERIGDPAWAALLTGDSDGLPEDQGWRSQALRCATGDGVGCRDLATALSVTGRPVDWLRSDMLARRGCASGDEESCAMYMGDGESLPTLDPDSAGRDALMPNLGDTLTYDSGIGVGPTEEVLRTFLANCEREGVWPHCDGLIHTWNFSGTPADPENNADTYFSKACAGDPDGVACALIADRSGKPALDGLASDVALLEAVCNRGTAPRACVAAARLVDLGSAHAYGSAHALDLMQSACNGGDQEGCDALTFAYTGSVGPKIRRECDSVRAGSGGDPRTCTSQAGMLLFGVGVPKDEAAAATLRDEACRLGDPTPCVWSGNELWGQEKYVEAFEWYERGCEAGDAAACATVGRMLTKGESGVTADVARGVPLLAQGCEGGAGHGCFELGYLFSIGKHVEQDRVRAAQLYERSCALGYLNGCGSLGVYYLDGRGVPLDLDAALWLLRESCEGGFGGACNNLGRMYGEGLSGTPRDPDKAAWAFGHGCELEHKAACTALEAMGSPVASTRPEGGSPPPIPARAYNGAASKRPWQLPRGWTPAPSVDPTPAPTPTPTPDPDPDPTPRPPSTRPGPPPALIAAQIGTQRSWSDTVQAGVLRADFGIAPRWIAAGVGVDWVSDNRWRSKVARSYFRLNFRGFAAANLVFSPGLSLWIGGGGSAGAYRRGPGTNNDIIGAAGVFEFVQFNVRVEGFLVGVRIEQQQQWQDDPDMPIDHVTAGTLVVGATFVR